MPDPEYGKITDEKLALLRERIGVDLDPENFEPPAVDATDWQSRSNGFNRLTLT